MAIVHTAHATYQLDITLVSQNVAANQSTINIHLYAYADSGFGSGTFANGIGWSSQGGAGTFDIRGASVEIANYNIVVTHDAAGRLSYNIPAHVNDTGTSVYGGPVDLSQAGSLPRIPKPPGAPALTVAPPVGLSVTVTPTIPAGYDDGGAVVISVTTQYSKDGGAWTGSHSGAWNAPYTYTQLPPGSYRFRAYATNSRGNSQYSAISTVTVKSGGKVRVGGAWKQGIARVRVGGVWRDAIVKVRVGGTWKDAQ